MRKRGLLEGKIHIFEKHNLELKKYAVCVTKILLKIFPQQGWCSDPLTEKKLFYEPANVLL